MAKKNPKPQPPKDTSDVASVSSEANQGAELMTQPLDSDSKVDEASKHETGEDAMKDHPKFAKFK